MTGTQPLFSWIAPPGAFDYRLVVFDPVEQAPIDVYLEATSYRAPPRTLSPGIEYRWKVKARWTSPAGERWSDPPEGIYFRVGCTPPPGAETVTYYHLDAIGSVRAVTNQAGAVVEQHDYLPFGEEWCGTGPCAPNAGGEPMRFTGKERDAETGLDYFGARYYRPGIGRFTAVDPIQTTTQNLLDPQRWNRYTYARNNPLRYVDPDGRAIVPKAIKLIVKGGDVASTFAGVVDDAAVLFSADPTVGTAARLLAAASLTSELLPVSGRDVKEGAELAVRLTKRGTNQAGEVTGRASFRKATVQDAWDNAAHGPTGGRLCPTCGTEVDVAPFSGEPRDWDVSHDPSWSRREFPADVDRSQVRDNYQAGTGLECPGCNRGFGNRDELRPNQ